MKIGIDASRYRNTDATGVEWYSFHIINSLLKVLPVEDKATLYSQSPIVFGSNIENKVISVSRLWTIYGLSMEMKKNSVDALFVPSHVLPLKLPQRSVITIHDVAFKYLKSSYSFKQYHYLNLTTKYAVKVASQIIVPSMATKNDLVKFYGCDKDKISVVYHGFNAPDFSEKETDDAFDNADFVKHFGLKKDDKYLLFVGRLESKKNLPRLVEAFAEALKTHIDYKLILAGKRGVGFYRIMKIIDKLKLGDKVVMPGYITEVEKASLFKYCQAFLFPSLYEGFGLPLLESFYYKKPVLASNVPCLLEIGADCAHFVDPYDAKAIANGICKIVDEKQYCDKLVLRGSSRLTEFSWEKAAKETLKIIHG